MGRLRTNPICEQIFRIADERSQDLVQLYFTDCDFLPLTLSTPPLLIFKLLWNLKHTHTYTTFSFPVRSVFKVLASRVSGTSAHIHEPVSQPTDQPTNQPSSLPFLVPGEGKASAVPCPHYSWFPAVTAAIWFLLQGIPGWTCTRKKSLHLKIMRRRKDA